MENKTYIYALLEGNSSDYRYVGKSINPKKRLYQHLSSSKNQKTHKDRWIQSALKKGYKICFEILEEVNDVNWPEREIFWISHLKESGYKLTNSTEGGDCGPTILKDYLSFSEAKKFVHNLNLNCRSEWKIYCKNEKPENIPFRPDIVYKNKGWSGLGDWLGTGRVANFDKKFISYQKAKDIIKSFNIKTNNEWRDFCKNNKPDNIPSNPDQYYLDKGWISWSDFLNNSNIQNQKIKFIDFESAKNEIRKFNIKSVKDWRLFKNSNKKPNLIPSSPESVYKSEWRGFPDFLGY